MDEADLSSPGPRLKWAREQAGHADRGVFARAMGVKEVTYRAYENDQNGYAKHAVRFAEALGVPVAWLLEGGDTPKPEPSILPPTNAVPFKMEGAPDVTMPRDVPIYGTALGADEIVDGEAIEQTTLNNAEVIGYLRRPPILASRSDAYGLYVQGSSMYPRYRDGATVFVERKRGPHVGDDVVVYLRMPDDHDGERPSCVLIKELVKKSASFIELQQFNPPLVFRLPMERVSQIDRVLPIEELVS